MSMANNNEMIQQLNRIADALEISATDREEELDEQAKRKAAYALNLCMVSVSQIIDYGDLLVLEQEYENILNNLNLEHIPKDDALLEILRQLLDTITFFRIQDKEKYFIEKNYKNKLKTAIWKAMPNSQVILSSGHWVAMLVTLACQVGTGYMNYRDARAQADEYLETETWKLQRAAIEQFNGLRRDLFTTAWNLAKRYKFEDQWRLTEGQITQYNRVLMDPNLNRRLARLEDLEDNFVAYPPFWYFKGHTALQISEADPESSNEMKTAARAAFERYFEVNALGHELLRTDSVYASCALEYVSLLGEDETDKKYEYIRRAINNAGEHFDILQLCAMAYLDIGESELAVGILRRLVCEGYNEDLNAQLLSAIYVEEFLSESRDGARCRADYNFLCKVANGSELIPWPENNEGSVGEQYARFIENRKEALLESYANFIVRYFAFKSKEFCLAVNVVKDDRECELVRFIKGLHEELTSFPGADIGQTDFMQLVKENKSVLDLAIKTGKLTSKDFELVFGGVFLACAENISGMSITSMEEITRLEIELGIAASKFAEKNALGIF